MAEASTISIPQAQETRTASIHRGRYRYRYAYARSADSRAADDTGQDYLTIRERGDRLAFALCDGVSQSFMGDLAARLLGESLLEWLWGCVLAGDAEVLRGALEAYLRQLPEQAGQLVREYTLPDTLPPLVQQVLEQKRGLGSESTFAAGLLDVAGGKLLLAWMGDSRIRVWGPQSERSDELGNTFHTRERWSSRQGLVGDLHVALLSLDQLRRIAVYSDGLAQLDTHAEPLSDQALDELITKAGTMPASDDISFLEIVIGQERSVAVRRRLAAPQKPSLNRQGIHLMLLWQPVLGASGYRVAAHEQPELQWDVARPVWQIKQHELAPQVRSLRVCALAGSEVGEWSAPVSLPAGAASTTSPQPPVVDDRLVRRQAAPDQSSDARASVPPPKRTPTTRNREHSASAPAADWRASAPSAKRGKSPSFLRSLLIVLVALALTCVIGSYFVGQVSHVFAPPAPKSTPVRPKPSALPAPRDPNRQSQPPRATMGVPLGPPVSGGSDQFQGTNQLLPGQPGGLIPTKTQQVPP